MSNSHSSSHETRRPEVQQAKRWTVTSGDWACMFWVMIKNQFRDLSFIFLKLVINLLPLCTESLLLSTLIKLSCGEWREQRVFFRVNLVSNRYWSLLLESELNRWQESLLASYPCRNTLVSVSSNEFHWQWKGRARSDTTQSRQIYYNFAWTLEFHYLRK